MLLDEVNLDYPPYYWAINAAKAFLIASASASKPPWPPCPNPGISSPSPH
jgi:hypothetical protein